MRKQSTHIALFGLFGVSNLGNDASLQAMLTHIRQQRPEAVISCVCFDPEQIIERFGIAAVPIAQAPTAAYRQEPTNRLLRLLWKGGRRAWLEPQLWYRMLSYLRQVDQMIIPGTGILDDFGVHPLQMPYDLFRWVLGARLSGVKVYFASIGAGPIHHPLSRWFMKSAAALAHYRSYRDEISKEFMDSIQFDTERDPVYPDLVFSLPRPTAQVDGANSHTPKVVGLGVMEYYGWRNLANNGEEIYQRYVEKLGAFAVWLLDQGYAIKILIGQAHDQRAVDDIQHYIQQMAPHTPQCKVQAESITTIEALLGAIVDTDLVVATRFHNVLCALMLNKPVVSLGYAKKNDVLMTEMGLGDYCQHIETFDVACLKQQFTELARNASVFHAQMQQKNREYEHALQDQYERILAGA
ncbi:MAG: polysaccharide pyruvyl transferase family protein [Caldilineaceae bacterium]